MAGPSRSTPSPSWRWIKRDQKERRRWHSAGRCRPMWCWWDCCRITICAACRWGIRCWVATSPMPPSPRCRSQTLWSDGTTHLLLSPLELIEKLAALIPPPRLNLVRYHGILAPHARDRRRRSCPVHPCPRQRLRRVLLAVPPAVVDLADRPRLDSYLSDRSDNRSERYPCAR